MSKKDKYACFQWIRDARARINEEVERMTPEEHVAYTHAEAKRILKTLPKLTVEEARREREAFLRPAEEEPVASHKSKPAREISRHRKASKQLAHA